MTRYIDADKLIKEIISKDENMADISNNRHRGMFTNDIISCIKGMPTEDVKPVIHSRWIEERNDFGVLLRWHCENCFDKTGMGSTMQEDFCPICGAIMDLKD